MSHFMEVGIFRIGLNRTDFGCWQLTLNQKPNLSSNSQMAIYLESLSSMVHFPFNHVKELELSNNCAKLQVKTWGRFFLQ